LLKSGVYVEKLRDPECRFSCEYRVFLCGEEDGQRQRFNSFGTAVEEAAALVAITFFVAIGWIAAFAVTGYFKGNFVCPRCGENFFRRWDPRPWRQSFRSNIFARHCMHCGLPKWAAQDETR
jgi:hypothetical protein